MTAYFTWEQSVAERWAPVLYSAKPLYTKDNGQPRVHSTVHEVGDDATLDECVKSFPAPKEQSS